MNLDHYDFDEDDFRHPPGPPGWFTALGLVLGVVVLAVFFTAD